MNTDFINEFNEKNKELGKRLILLSSKVCDNQESDPPIEEINDIMFDISNMISKDVVLNGRPSDLSLAIEQKLSKMMTIVLPQLMSEKHDLKASELQAYFLDKMNTLRNHNSLGDEDMKKTMNKVCDTNLYIHQTIRKIKNSGEKETLIYTNKEDYREIGLLCEITDLSGTSQRLVDEIDDAYFRNTEDFNVGREIRSNIEKASRERSSRRP